MFRIIVISLFVANLLLAVFQASNPAVKEQAANPVMAAENDNIPTIHLFSELVQDRDLMSGNRQCFTLGPFHDIEDMQEVRSRLQEVSLNTYDRQTQALVEKGYWVFLRPYRSLLEANKALFALQALGLEDSSVVYEGKLRNAISLGYFLRQENAIKRQQALKARGYEPLVRVQRQAEPRYWLDYEQAPGSEMIALDMQSRPNDFMQRSMPCPEQSQTEAIATESGPPEPELLESKSLESERSESEPPALEVSTTESEQSQAGPLESGLPKSEPSELELPKLETSEPESLELESPGTEPPEPGPPESELPKSGLLRLGPPVLEPLESEPPAASEAPLQTHTLEDLQTDTLKERDGPESGDGEADGGN